MFYFEKIQEKNILKSDYLDDSKVKHIFTTRESVVVPKEQFNLFEECNKNFDIIANYLNIKKENIIIPFQTHSSNVQIATRDKFYPNTDALILDNKDVAILLNFADCTPIILYDEENNIGAIAHAGWKGTAASIVKETVKKMQKIYNTNPQKLVAIIGPAISMKNYEVSVDVYNALCKTLNSQYNDWYKHDDDKNNYYVDLKTVNQHQLEELGILRIDKCNYCTYDSVDVFFSYRKELGKTARHSAILKLV